MKETFFSAALMLTLLAGGTVAVGSEWFAAAPARPTARVVAAATPRDVVVLPAVTITAHRGVAHGLEVAMRASQTQRVQ